MNSRLYDCDREAVARSFDAVCGDESVYCPFQLIKDDREAIRINSSPTRDRRFLSSKC